jgi:hypothetical protein
VVVDADDQATIVDLHRLATAELVVVLAAPERVDEQDGRGRALARLDLGAIAHRVEQALSLLARLPVRREDLLAATHHLAAALVILTLIGQQRARRRIVVVVQRTREGGGDHRALHRSSLRRRATPGQARRLRATA